MVEGIIGYCIGVLAGIFLYIYKQDIIMGYRNLGLSLFKQYISALIFIFFDRA